MTDRKIDDDMYLSAFMLLMSTLSEDAQNKIAQDVLVEVPHVVKSNPEKFLEFVNERNPKYVNRWYDSNPNLQAVFKAIKNLDSDERFALYETIEKITQENVLKETKTVDEMIAEKEKNKGN